MTQIISYKLTNCVLELCLVILMLSVVSTSQEIHLIVTFYRI
uniref:Uncharacterized protein n=1 Tax=Rhizophora mucronata TaxID=61149 RepID=A0A2P2NY79_RHIMU